MDLLVEAPDGHGGKVIGKKGMGYDDRIYLGVPEKWMSGLCVTTGHDLWNVVKNVREA